MSMSEFFGLFFGGFGLALWATVHIEDDRRILRRVLTVFGIGCTEGVLLFLVAWMFHPYTWGLPPEWLPAKWNPCPQDYRANVLPTEKQIAIIGSRKLVFEVDKLQYQLHSLVDVIDGRDDSHEH